MKHGDGDGGAEVLGRLLAELRVPVAALSLLLGHARAVLADADRLGLVTERQLEEIVRRHTADSLLFALVRGPLPGERWVDVGSGAGFPGLPLACAFPSTSFALVEPQRRRAAFLELVVGNLGLTNVEVIPQAAESLDSRFDCAVARALSAPPSALGTLIRLVGPGRGLAIVAAGPTAQISPNVQEVSIQRVGVDSPGRLLIMTGPSEAP